MDLTGRVRIELGTREPEQFRENRGNHWNRRLEPEPVEPELEQVEPGFGTGTGGTGTGTVRMDRPYRRSVRTLRTPYGPSVRTVRADDPY